MMTYKAIRRYAVAEAEAFSECVQRQATGDMARAIEIENRVIARATDARGFVSCRPGEQKAHFLIATFVRVCRKNGVSTRAIHFAKNGEVR